MLILESWVLIGWGLSILYFGQAKMLNDWFTWVLIVIDGAVLGPLAMLCFIIQPPKGKP